MSFNPLGNMWSLISPYFALENNPWYYVMGAVVFCFEKRIERMYKEKRNSLFNQTGDGLTDLSR